MAGGLVFLRALAVSGMAGTLLDQSGSDSSGYALEILLGKLGLRGEEFLGGEGRTGLGGEFGEGLGGGNLGGPIGLGDASLKGGVGRGFVEEGADGRLLASLVLDLSGLDFCGSSAGLDAEFRMIAG
jgi:hypothetical protein